MNSRTWLWFALPFMLLLAGCSGGGGGTGLQSSLPLALQAYLKASNTNISDHFGRKMAIDGNTLVIGVPDESSNGTGVNPAAPAQTDNSASGSGAVYVFTRTAGVWSQQAYVKASNTEASDGFGTSVAISGDTLVVGAPGEDSNGIGVNPAAPAQTDNSASGSGAVYVFTRTAGVWSQQAYVKASNTEASDGFGTSVAIDGNTVAVGAAGEDSNAMGVNPGLVAEADNTANASGAVYVFTRSGATWTQQAYVKASNTEASDGFGTSVAIDGNTVAVGAAGEDSNAMGVNPGLVAEADNTANASGAVYVFTRSGATWTQQAYVKASNTGAGDGFGSSVAISTDTLVVGAPDEDSSGTGVNPIAPAQTDNSASDSGAAYVFTRSGTTWSQQTYAKASNTETGDAFGTSVAISGNTLVVGAPGEDSDITTVIQGLPNEITTGNGALNAGAAYLFMTDGGGWSQQAYVKSSNTDASDAFGTSVAISGDTLVVSATGEDSSATGIGGDQTDSSAADSGAAYVFR